jgi:hypothetical protein
MKTFKALYEAWTNDIGKSSKEKSVTDSTKYDSPTDFKKNATKVGKVGPLEIHSSETPSGGMTHFTWSPEDRMIHHVVHAVSHKETDGKHELNFLSAHSREKSPVRMGHVYSTLAKEHGREFVGTGHSEGARKMWSKFHDDPDLEVVGQHPDGRIQKLNKNDKMYASKKTTNPEEQKIGRMKLIMRKKTVKEDASDPMITHRKKIDAKRLTPGSRGGEGGGSDGSGSGNGSE